jgi:hypothetical protein
VFYEDEQTDTKSEGGEHPVPEEGRSFRVLKSHSRSSVNRL